MAESQNQYRMRCNNCGATFGSRISAFGTEIQIEGHWVACSFCGHANLSPNGTFDEIIQNQPDESKPRDLGYPTVGPDYLKALTRGVFQKGSNNPAMIRPVSSFTTNVSRLSSVFSLPMQAIIVRGQLQQYECEAKLRLFNSLKYEPVSDLERDQLSQLTRDLWGNLLEESGAEATRTVMTKYAAVGMGKLLSLELASVWLGIDALLTGQITGMWTAFEVLAGDLWEESLNTHPQTLTDLKGKQRMESRGKNEGTSKLPKNQDKAIELHTLQRYGYDLSKRMGSVLRAKFDFDSLHGLRAGYCQAFGDPSINSILERPALRLLSCVRNVLVHREGIVDEKAKNEFAAFPKLNSVAIGQRMPIDCHLVKELVDPAIDASLDLIGAVDTWLINHPQKRRKDVV